MYSLLGCRARQLQAPVRRLPTHPSSTVLVLVRRCISWGPQREIPRDSQKHSNAAPPHAACGEAAAHECFAGAVGHGIMGRFYGLNRARFCSAQRIEYKLQNDPPLDTGEAESFGIVHRWTAEKLRNAIEQGPGVARHSSCVHQNRRGVGASKRRRQAIAGR
jgi:hypothetical protein